MRDLAGCTSRNMLRQWGIRDIDRPGSNVAPLCSSALVEAPGGYTSPQRPYQRR